MGRQTHMRYRYRRRKRNTRRGTLALLLVLSAVFLVSCVAGSNPLWVRSMFGLDVANYHAEPTQKALSASGETANALCDMVEILTASSVELQEFRTASQAVKHYRDEILTDMLRDNYTLYNGNTQLLSCMEAAYPNTVITTFIPEADFENAVFRSFGETGSVKHGDGKVFDYLKAAGGYTSPVQIHDPEVEIRVTSLEETHHTYRMAFELRSHNETASYFTVFVKRDDGSCYFYSLERL